MTWPPRAGEPPTGPPSPGPPPGPPYGPPGYGGPPATGTNLLAILALAFAFGFPPAGIVLGHLARRQISTTGEQGAGLATAGLVLGYVFTALGLLACCGLIVLLSSANRS